MKSVMFIDNGVTGTIAVVDDVFNSAFIETPIVDQQDYTKARKRIHRIDTKALMDVLMSWKPNIAVLERPLINPARFTASISAARALEATISTLEMYGLPYMFCDSREWQREVLPKGVSGADQLKRASMDIGIRLFPQHEELIRKHKDADSLLGAYVFLHKI